jgi:DNA-binding LytR/AlgR family response regulator
METTTILLVEDDFLNRRLSKKILAENGYRILEAKSAAKAFEILRKEPVALAILDINLGEEKHGGISIGQELQHTYKIPFLYLTAYDTTDIVTKAVATSPHAYLTKPYKNIDLLTSVALALRQYHHKETPAATLQVKDGDFYVRLPVADICFIEADGNYLLFHADTKVYKTRATIKQILEELPADTFIQTHRAFIVNKTKVDKFNVKHLVVSNEIIPVSKFYIDNISAMWQ